MSRPCSSISLVISPTRVVRASASADATRAGLRNTGAEGADDAYEGDSLSSLCSKLRNWRGRSRSCSILLSSRLKRASIAAMRASLGPEETDDATWAAMAGVDEGDGVREGSRRWSLRGRWSSGADGAGRRAAGTATGREADSTAAHEGGAEVLGTCDDEDGTADTCRAVTGASSGVRQRRLLSRYANRPHSPRPRARQGYTSQTTFSAAAESSGCCRRTVLILGR